MKKNLVNLAILIIIALMFPVRAISSNVALDLLQEQAKKGNAEAQEKLGDVFITEIKLKRIITRQLNGSEKLQIREI